MNINYQKVFAEEGIFLCEALPYSLCHVVASHKIAKLSFSPVSVIVFLMPYYTKIEGARNLSRYAVAKDYHAYVKMLSERLVAKLSAMHPENGFAMFSDNSPIDERHAATLAGLGVIGDSGLVLTKRYGSYVFIGEIVSDLPISTVGGKRSYQVKSCHHCGACKSACPKKDVCLSALTQKKGALTPMEEDRIRRLGSVWGCDICQEVCPYNAEIEETPIAFFKEDLLPCVTEDAVFSMSDQEFRERAYSWRGRNTILRNLKIMKNDL